MFYFGFLNLDRIYIDENGTVLQKLFMLFFYFSPFVVSSPKKKKTESFVVY